MICLDYFQPQAFDVMDIDGKEHYMQSLADRKTNLQKVDLPEQVWKLIFDYLNLSECAVASAVSSEWKRMIWASKYELTIPNKYKHYLSIFTDKQLYWISNHCYQLRTLDISGIQSITDYGIVFISRLKNLMKLNMSRCISITSQVLGKTLCELESLQTLNVSWCCQLNDTFFETIAESFRLKESLNHLDASFVTQLTDEALYFISNFGRLKTLSLNGCDSLTRKGFEEMLKFLPRLAYLEIRWISLSDRKHVLIRPIQLLNRQHSRRDPMFGASYCSSPNGSPRPLNVSHCKLDKESIPKLVSFAYSNDRKLLMESLIGLRKLLSIETAPPIDEVVHSGVIPRLVEMLRIPDPMIQFESAWILTNIASGTSNHTQTLIDHGTIPIFIELAQSKDNDVRAQAIWTLGNIAGDSSATRDLVIDSGALNAILSSIQYAKQTGSLHLLRNTSWCLSNLCRGSPIPDLEKIKPAIPFLLELIHFGDEEVAADACWSISYLAGGDEDDINTVIQCGVITEILKLLSHPSPLIVSPALRTIGNIATGSDQQTQILLDMNILPFLVSLISSNSRKAILKEACWTLSNITAGPAHHIQAVIDSGLVAKIVQILQQQNVDLDVRKECAWVISNATMAATTQQVEYFVFLGCIPPLCQMLDNADDGLCSVVLEGLRNIVLHDRQTYLRLVEKSIDEDYLEDIASSGAEDVSAKATELLEWIHDS